MKAHYSVFLLSFLFIFSIVRSNEPMQTEQTGENLEITVSYVKQSGPGSNQYAVWIEDSDGKFVKTLFVTNYTAKGGYIKRPACLPLWRSKAGIENMSESEIDAVAGATPQTGDQVYVWNLTDKNGNKVSSGNYTFYVEANLLGESMVIYKGVVNVGNTADNINVSREYTSNEDKNRGMITAVQAVYK